MLRTVTATRYVTPLREGGSLPAIVEADDLGTYVLKFRGAGQGRKALVAELVTGSRKQPLYWLAFAARHSKALEFWEKIRYLEPNPQQELMLTE
jgi:hypothetical protein